MQANPEQGTAVEEPTTGAGVGHSPGSLRFRGVTKRYGSFEAVSNLDLDIRDGEFLTILGPSGSGKTTMLSLIAGFQTPTEGTVYLGDARLDTLPPEQRNVGMVFQNYALFPHLTITQNVGFPLKMRGIGRAETARRVAAALELVQMSDNAKKFPTQLSGGQQQRVALARALVFEPPVLLMDEPLGALDRRLREVVQFELVRLHSQIASTIVYVTHDQDEALTMSDRIAIMNAGRIEQLGTPREIYHDPVNSFVAKFMGDSVEFPGTVTACDAHSCEIRLATGETVVGQAPRPLAVGAEIALIVRPERLAIESAPDGPGVRARVVEQQYMGQRNRYGLELADGSVVHVIRENALGTTIHSEGDVVRCSWDPDDAVALA